MRKIVWSVLIGAGLATVIGAGVTLTPAVSRTIRAVLTRNVDEPARNPYQKMLFEPPFLDYAYFDPVPSGKRLVITRISGYYSGVSVSDPSMIQPMILENNQQSVRQYVPVVVQGGLLYANADVRMYFDAGDQPIVFVNEDVIDLTVTISGYTIDVPDANHD